MQGVKLREHNQAQRDHGRYGCRDNRLRTKFPELLRVRNWTPDRCMSLTQLEAFRNGMTQGEVSVNWNDAVRM